jgi:hypothetical protein
MLAMSGRVLALNAKIFGTLAGEALMNSTAWQSINESWMHLQPTYEIYSFYETLAASMGLKNALVKAFFLIYY